MSFEEKQQFEDIPRNGGQRSFFRTVFTGGRVEIGTPLNPTEYEGRPSYMKFNNFRKCLLVIIICALALTALLVIKQFTNKDSPEPNSSAVQSTDTNIYLTANQLINDSNKEVSERTAPQTSTTTSTTTTTMSTTTMGTTTTTTPAPKIIDHLLATIVINNATVPNKDGYVSLTDTYVKAYVDDNYIGQTPVKKETLKPVWNYQIAHQMTLRPESVLKFKLYDNDKYSSHEFLGEFEVKTSELLTDERNGEPVSRWHGSGHLWFTVIWEEVYRNY